MPNVGEILAAIVAGATIATGIWHAGMYVGKLTLGQKRHEDQIDNHRERLDDHEERLDRIDRPLGIR